MPKKHSGSLCLPDAWTLRGSALSPLEVRGGGGEEVVPSAWLPQGVPHLPSLFPSLYCSSTGWNRNQAEKVPLCEQRSWMLNKGSF